MISNSVLNSLFFFSIRDTEYLACAEPLRREGPSAAAEILVLYCFMAEKSDVKSIDFAVTRLSIDVINDCRTNFSVMLPSEMIEIEKGQIRNQI